MNPFEMVVAIVVVVFAARIIRDRYRVQALADVRGPDGDVARMAAELAALRERVQVLERALTDQHGAAELDRQIERLRDRKEV